MGVNYIYFIYGLCVMFYLMTSWLFWRRGNDRISRLVALLMLYIGIGCIKDLWFVHDIHGIGRKLWFVVACVDMLAVPMYTFVLIELCAPLSLTRGKVLLHLAPFVVLPVLFIATDNELFYDINIFYAAIYGTIFAVRTLFAITRYHKRLKENFSYVENINLNWLRVILFSFFIILGLWVVDCVIISYSIEGTYLAVSLVLWIFVCYFLYRHESVIDELRLGEPAAATHPEAHPEAQIGIAAIVDRLFIDEKLYLNPKLKLSDVAKLVGTNRTYLSNFFNRQTGSTFYDYVNGLRIEYAEKMLAETPDPQTVIAERAGFNSLSTFRRAFEKKHGCSPTEYRLRNTNA